MTTTPTTPATHQAWHGLHELKERFVRAAIDHREADRYLQGTYAEGSGDEFKACSVGCSLATVHGDMNPKDHDYGDHALLAERLGVPEFITRMQDCIFEGLPQEDAIVWTERLFSAIPAGVDLSSVQPRFLLALQRRTLGLVDREAFPDVCDAVEGVIDVLDAWGRTGRADESAAESAAESAWSAAESAWSAWSAESARSAARSAESAESAESAAWSARSAARFAESARSAAESAWSAAESAWSAESAESAAYQWMADTLIRMVRESTLRD